MDRLYSGGFRVETTVVEIAITVQQVLDYNRDRVYLRIQSVTQGGPNTFEWSVDGGNVGLPSGVNAVWAVELTWWDHPGIVQSKLYLSVPIPPVQVLITESFLR